MDFDFWNIALDKGYNIYGTQHYHTIKFPCSIFSCCESTLVVWFLCLWISNKATGDKRLSFVHACLVPCVIYPYCLLTLKKCIWHWVEIDSWSWRGGSLCIFHWIRKNLAFPLHLFTNILTRAMVITTFGLQSMIPSVSRLKNPIFFPSMLPTSYEHWDLCLSLFINKGTR